MCVRVCVQHCDSSGRKEVTRHLIFHELLSLRLAGYITDANTEHWPPPGKSVARNRSHTVVPAALCIYGCMHEKYAEQDSEWISWFWGHYRVRDNFK